MTTMHNRRRLTEADLDRHIDSAQEAARDAAALVIERARRAGLECPPCHGNCSQCRDCPARARQLLQADAQATASWRTEAALGVLLVGAFALAGLAKAHGWL